MTKARRVAAGPLGVMHDFVVTARHLMIVIPPLVFEPAPGRSLLLDAHVWRPELGYRVLVVGKDDFNAGAGTSFPPGSDSTTVTDGRTRAESSASTIPCPSPSTLTSARAEGHTKPGVTSRGDG